MAYASRVESPAHRNLFPDALPHVASWADGRLEPRSNVAWSSQALCVSVFGTIAERPSRRELMSQILREARVELRADDEPTLECEVRGRRDLLNEYGGSNPTCPDVLVRWPTAVLTIESKFTEHLGPCGQIELSRRQGRRKIRPGACSGNHGEGSDLRTQTTAACRLTVPENEGRRGHRSPRRYWEVGSMVFRREVVALPSSPCPFADGKYQLMRNLCFAAALAEAEGLPRFGLLLAHVGAAPSARDSAEEYREFRDLLLPAMMSRVGAITYERIGEILRCSGETELADWLDVRLAAGLTAEAMR